jgi:hypothetical protein
MEYEEIVVSDSQFEHMAKVPGVKRDETGKLLTWENGEAGYKYIRHRDWEKGQPAFGPEALAGRERIEKARALRYREPESIEPLLRMHEYAILRNATPEELEAYVASEEAITVCQLKQRDILKAGGLRGKVWGDEEAAESYLHEWLDCSSYRPVQRDWPGLEAIEEALRGEEISWLDALYEQITAAEQTQRDVGQLVSTRYIDSHPEKYPNG